MLRRYMIVWYTPRLDSSRATIMAEPTVTVTPTVHVEIRHQDRDSKFVLSFMDWMGEAKVFPIRGTGSSSPVTRMGSQWYDGQWVGVFDAADYPAVKAWLAVHTPHTGRGQ